MLSASVMVRLMDASGSMFVADDAGVRLVKVGAVESPPTL